MKYFITDNHIYLSHNDCFGRIKPERNRNDIVSFVEKHNYIWTRKLGNYTEYEIENSPMESILETVRDEKY